MFATVRVFMSLQVNERIDKALYPLLEYHCDIPLESIQSAFLRVGQTCTQRIISKSVDISAKSPAHVIGSVAAAATARALLRLGNEIAVDATTDSIAVTGYMTTARGIATVTGATLAFVLLTSTVVELPFLARGLYKLHRKKKFDQIDEVAFKKGCAKQISVSAGAIIGGTAGAFGGLFIPVPAVGSMLTGAAGSLVGITVGHVVGYGIGSTFKEGMVPDFVIVRKHLYTDFP